jgi:membrane-bound inhibitor of C-type lysozyme
MFRNGTRMTVAAIAAGLIAGFAGTARAQDAEPMDEQDPVAITCEDGTELGALFDEAGVVVILSDGTEVKLPQKAAGDSFSYSDGKYTLSGDDKGAQWTVGKKAPTACQFADADGPTVFDEPVSVDMTPLPADKANPDAQPQVSCYRFAGFAVKEVDLGEKGAESLAITAKDAACARAPGKGETVVDDEVAGYFLGAKGHFVFFQAADGWNGGLPFVVYDGRNGTRLFEDSFTGDDFGSLAVDGETLKLTFRRVYSADCSLFKDAATCGAAVGKATGLGAATPLPDCAATYEAEKKRTPDYAKEIEELPSVISYEAELTFDGKAVSVKPLAGPARCDVPT